MNILNLSIHLMLKIARYLHICKYRSVMQLKACFSYKLLIRMLGQTFDFS